MPHPLLLALLFGMSAPAITAAPAVTPPADRLVRLPDGRGLNFLCAGAGSPTVLLEAGWSADSRAWTRVIPPLAARTRVCAYDRAGSGRSDPGPLPRDGAAIAADLSAGLRAARIAGPFVVVGHSAGGLYMRLFADRRPHDVIGMVLVDTSVEHQPARLATATGDPKAGSVEPLVRGAARCLAAARAGTPPAADPALTRCAVEPPSAGVARWTARLSELQTLFGATSAEVDAGRRSYGAMPLVTLTAGHGDARAAGGPWYALHREVAARSSRGEARLVADSGHLMMVDRPDAIVGAVLDVIAASKAAR